MTLYVLDYPFCCNGWNFILCNGWVIFLLKIYKHAFLLIKYPCSTRDLGPPCPSFCLHSLRSVEACHTHFLARAFMTSLRGRPVPSGAVQALCMGFIGFPHNSRDTALSLFFSFFSSTLVPRSQSVKDCNKIGWWKSYKWLRGAHWWDDQIKCLDVCFHSFKWFSLGCSLESPGRLKNLPRPTSRESHLIDLGRGQAWEAVMF